MGVDLRRPHLRLSSWQVLVEHAYFGERWMRIPKVEVRNLRFFPGTRFNLSPFGTSTTSICSW
jgi:hypothetical protein